MCCRLIPAMSERMVRIINPVVPETPLWDMAKNGEFIEEGELEKLGELQGFLRCLNCETTFMNEHASNFFHIACELPRRRGEAIAYVQSVVDTSDEDELRRYREAAVQVF